ncbi:MAG: hypothetical protein ACYC7F_03890 [Gemmatimonadaceae bacterium]
MLRTRPAALVMVSLVIALATPHLNAQAPAGRRAVAQPTARFGLAGGLSVPAGDLGADAGLGLAVGLRAETPLRDARWALRGDLNWDRYDGSGVVNAYSYASLAGNLVHRERVSGLYQYGGLGIFSSRMRFVSGNDRRDSNLGMQAGVGFTWNRLSPRWFTEFGLTSAFTSGRSIVWFPLRAGFWF